MRIFVKTSQRQWTIHSYSASRNLLFRHHRTAPPPDCVTHLGKYYSIVVSADDIPIGLGHTYYYEQPVQTMTLENFDFAVTISDTNVNNNQ